MLTLLKIKNIALIDDLSIEFGPGLNLLTGETGSGKSIIVDSLGALTGDRVSADLIKDGASTAQIEGLFNVEAGPELVSTLGDSGITADHGELIVRRELSVAGKNRVFINDQLVTQGLLKRIGHLLVDIHGQGEQAALYDTETHIEMLDRFADVDKTRERVAAAFARLAQLRADLASLNEDEAGKLQLVDILKFQTDEIRNAALTPNEDGELEEEKRRLSNIEKVTSLSDEAFALLYDNAESTTSTLERAQRKVADLAEYESTFGDYAEGIATARAVIEDLSIALRDFRTRLEFSPERLDEIENRLAEITSLKRKYGATIEDVLQHLITSEERLANIESAEFRQEELRREIAAAQKEYLSLAGKLHDERIAAAKKFNKLVESNLQAVALEKAKFETRIDDRRDDERAYSANGFDGVEFYFSANPGESPKPLAKVASGGEASRLMLILKTSARSSGAAKTAVFDEIDIGIGGRVAESVGRKLKELAATQQVLCVTHQPQIASLADHHFVVKKETANGPTMVIARQLTAAEQIEEIARMLAGEQITDAARDNARAMLAGK